MQMSEALHVMNCGLGKGFMVHFEWVEGGMLRSDYFPDIRAGEEPIATEEEAWRLAEKFAAKTTGKCVNIYVIDEKFMPVPSYKDKEIENR